MKILESIIKNITVFNDRAQIFRTAEFEVEKGEHILRFENLPASVESKSVQVNGKGAVILKNIKFKKVFFEEITNETVVKLQNEKQKLEIIIDEINDDIENAEKELEFIENIAQKTVHTNEKSKSELNPNNWIKMVEFYRNKLDSLNKEIRLKNLDLAKEENKLGKIQNEINQAGRSHNKTKNVVDVVVTAEEKTKVWLLLSYIVYGASWKPAYNIRVSSDEKTVLLEYNAQIKQFTGEDWKDVTVKLSTAQVQVGGTLPKLAPWHVDIYYPPVMSPVMQNVKFKTAKPKKGSKKRAILKEKEYEKLDFFEEAPPMIEKPTAQVEQKATSSVFTTEGKNTVLSDNLDYTVTILLTEFNAEFNYFAVPKLSPIAYLKAKVKNTTDFPLLTGGMNVFFDNSFVAESQLKHVLPDSDFDLSLGADESIKIEHKLVKKYNQHEGVFTKKNVEILEYETKIKNNKKTNISITVKDNIPVSQNDNIKVDLIIPKYKEDSKTLKIDKQGIITQKIEIEPGKELKQNLKFEVEYQKDIKITGL